MEMENRKIEIYLEDIFMVIFFLKTKENFIQDISFFKYT